MASDVDVRWMQFLQLRALFIFTSSDLTHILLYLNNSNNIIKLSKVKIIL